MENTKKLPDSKTVLNFLKQECTTEDIEEEILEKISKIVGNCFFERKSIEESIRTQQWPIKPLQIMSIGFALQCCAQGETPMISLVKGRSKPITNSPSEKKLPKSSGGFKSSDDNANVITPKFPDLYARLGMRTGSFTELCAKIHHQIKENNDYAKQNDFRSKILLEFFSKAQYSYEDGIIYLDHDPLKKIIKVVVEDVSEENIEQLKEAIGKYNLKIESFSTHSSSHDGYALRIRRELHNHSYYSYTVDSSMTISDDIESYSGYLIEWEKIKNSSFEELRNLSWGNSYNNWERLDVSKLSEPFMREFSNQVNWLAISRSKETLSEKFKTEFRDKLK